MLEITPYGEVTRYDLGRNFFGRGYYWTTCYRVNGLLIDSGCAHVAGEFSQALRDIKLQRIVNTHTHEDHIGANGRLQNERPDLLISAHPAALPVLTDPRRQQPLHPYRRLFWGWPTPCRAQPLADGEIITAGDLRLRVIYTPGHSPDHICLYEEQRGWLFTGDLFVGGRDRALRAGYDIWQIIESLKKIAELPATILFPGSARVRQEPQAELRAKVDYLEDLGQKVLALRRKGRSLAQIEGALLGGPMWVEVVTFGHFSRRHLLRSFLGQYS